jgi:hypothetical protein
MCVVGNSVGSTMPRFGVPRLWLGMSKLEKGVQQKYAKFDPLKKKMAQ